MRNLLVLTAALGLAGVASAQNSADIDQTGANNSATASQSGGATLAVTQGNSANTVTATQVGVSAATIVQSSTVASGGHTATITQVGGDGNLIDLSQRFGTPNPQGAHTATLSQDGNDNRISGAADATEEDGFDPASQQSRSNQRATVTQTGDRNAAEFSNGRPLTIDQDGSDNFARSTGGAAVDIDQIGDLNDAFNLGAAATIYQEGDRNEARAAGGFGGSAHAVDISQIGSDNIARATGDPRGGSTEISQDGDFNSALLDYGNPSNRDASGVDYSVTQDAGAFGAMGASNSFTATVRGEDNTATVSQTLTGAGMNAITLRQLSDGNTATLTQTGVGNSATVTQQ